jgi:hypothetical protein
VHAVAEVHDTALRTVLSMLSFGVDWMSHVVPFHTSARVYSVPPTLV